MSYKAVFHNKDLIFTIVKWIRDPETISKLGVCDKKLFEIVNRLVRSRYFLVDIVKSQRTLILGWILNKNCVRDSKWIWDAMNLAVSQDLSLSFVTFVNNSLHGMCGRTRSGGRKRKQKKRTKEAQPQQKRPRRIKTYVSTCSVMDMIPEIMKFDSYKCLGALYYANVQISDWYSSDWYNWSIDSENGGANHANYANCATIIKRLEKQFKVPFIPTPAGWDRDEFVFGICVLVYLSKVATVWNSPKCKRWVNIFIHSSRAGHILQDIRNVL